MQSSSKKIASLIDKAIFDYKMISDGDAILIGASGGKDSTALVEYFSNRAKRKNERVRYKAIFVQSDFATPFPRELEKKFSDWNVDFEKINVDVLARLKAGKKMNCWWCSTQRRSALLEYAVKNHFNKLALAHHLDDTLETLFMNMLSKAELSTMLPFFAYEKYPLALIRPLVYVSLKQLQNYAIEKKWASLTCTCNYQENSDRKKARDIVRYITNDNDDARMKIFHAVEQVAIRNSQ